MGLLATLGLAPSVKLKAAAKAAPVTVGGVAESGEEAGDGGAAPAVDKNLVAYQTARDAIGKLVDALRAHPQKDRLTAEIARADAKLVAADGHAAKKEFKEARARLEEARTICAVAQKLGAEWVQYARRRASANALIFSYKSPDNADWVKSQEALLANADLLAGATPPKFSAAYKELKTIEGNGKPGVKDSVDLVKQRLHQAEGADAKVRAYLKGDIDKAKPLVAQAEKAYADGEWALAQQASGAALDLLGPAVRMIDRRLKYDKQHAATTAAIGKLRASAPVKARVAELDATVVRADTLAAPDTMRVEEGLQLLVDAAARAAMVGRLVPVITAAGSERSAAEAELAALDQHAAAAKLTSERDAARALLASAQALAVQAEAAPDPLPGWNAVLTTLKRTCADLAVAKKLAAGLGATAAAETAAANPADTKGLKNALAALRADGKAAAKAPHAAAGEADFKRHEQRAADADKALAAGDTAAAATALTESAQALAAAKILQAGHAQFATTLAGVEAALKKLRASPRAAVIKARIDAAATELADAKAKDAAHAHPEAMAALRRATDAEAVARQADHDREHFDSEAAALAKRIAATKDAGTKKDLGDAAAAATKLADAFDFAAAGKALDAVEVSLDKLRLDSLMKDKKPDEKGIAALADRMVKKGGATTVDKMIHDVPDGGDPRLVNALAKGRYGVAFTTGKPLDANGDEAKAMRTVCDMFATFPQDVRGNPSIRGVRHEDKIPTPKGTGVGGGYYFDKGTITMTGRPNLAKQKFGANLKAVDPLTNAAVAQLPAAIDPDCQPANTDEVDFLSFAAAHEVGHGVDDANGFMKRHGDKPAYGGWISYGSSVQPLADIVGKHFGLDKAPEQKQYVFDLLQSKPPTRPAAAAGSPEEQALKNFEQWHQRATSKNIYRRHGDCLSIQIGDYIYHEAYARQWVGYLAAARSKGLTGYQFRAPGEWFAELYAGYRSGKLGPNHPAREWLAKL